MWGIAWRNFLLQRQRYRVLSTALVLGAVVFTVIFGVTASLTKTVREKAARFFSGDLVVLAVESKSTYTLDQEEALRQAIRDSGVPVAALHRRSVYYGSDAQLFFNGSSLIQRRVVGVDFSIEAHSFGGMDFVAGSAPQESDDPAAVWISDDTARRLHLNVGDSLILLLQTTKGFKNTIPLNVTGIFSDSSLFGFACYLDYRVLNKGLGRPETAITELGLTFDGSVDEWQAAQRLHSALSALVKTAPLSATKDGLDGWASANRNAPKAYGVLTLTARLRQINDLINAVKLVTILLTLVFLSVVAIGVYNTYQMIVFERTKEIGTLRALGMLRSRVVQLFLSECLFLALVGGVIGLVLGTAVLWGLGKIDFSGNLLAEMFLLRGHLAWTWPWENVLSVLLVVVFTTMAGAFLPALRGARQSPVDALRSE